jgi:hypothetical protein
MAEKPNLFTYAHDPWVVAVLVLLALVLVSVAFGVVVRACRRREIQAENAITVVVAAIATGVAAQGMWEFFRYTLLMPAVLAGLFFSFLELNVIGSAIRARSSMRRDYSPGVDGVAMWVLTCLSAVLAATHAASFGEVLFRLSAPLVAAYGWERSMRLERRARTGKLRGINWKVTPERILTRLGLADPTDRTVAEVSAERTLMTLAVAAHHARIAEASTGRGAARRARRAHRSLQTALQRALEYGRLGTDPASRDLLLAQLGVLYGAGSLLTIQPAAPWAQPAPAGPPDLKDAYTTLITAGALEVDDRTRAALEVPEQAPAAPAAQRAAQAALHAAQAAALPLLRAVPAPLEPGPVAGAGGSEPAPAPPLVSAAAVPQAPAEVPPLRPAADNATDAIRMLLGKGVQDEEVIASKVPDLVGRQVPRTTIARALRRIKSSKATADPQTGAYL